jgi:hypothetical protein
MDNDDSNVKQLIGEITALVTALPPALQRRAAEIKAIGKDSDMVDKLIKGADVMRDSGHVYVKWARHYAGLSEENTEDRDEAEFSV